jgi:hypothetical protein
MLKRKGGSGTINPYTGLPEYASIFKKIGNAVKKFAKSTVGKVIVGAALGFFVGPAAASFLGVTSTAGMAAVSGFVGGAGSTLAAGGGLKNALRSGALAALTAGAGAAITGGAAAFEPRPVFGGQNANIFGFGQPEVAPPTGVGTAAEIAAAPSSAVGAAPLPDQIAMLEANMAPQGYSSGYEMGLRQGPPPGASAAEVADYGRRHAMATVFNPSPDANLVQDVLGSRTSPVSLDTGGLRPDELTGDVARNTGSGVYSGGRFTPGDLGNPNNLQGAMRPFEPLSGPSGGGGKGIMDLIRQGEYGKAAGAAYDRIMPEALGGQRGAVTPDMIENMRSKAADIITAKDPSFAFKAATDPAAKAIFDKLVTDQATKLATPGMLSTYGPLAALGIGALGLAGGFKTKEAEMPDLFKGPTGFQLARMYPSMYGLQYGGVRPTAYGGMYLTPPGYAEGGGVMDTPQAMRVGGKTYPRKIGAINGPGTGTSDSIPAMLSDGEFVFTAKAVRAMGQGSRRKGAKKMYKLMKMLEGKAA